MSSINNELVPFTPANREACNVSLQEVENQLAPHLRSLTPDERRHKIKVGDKSLPFVGKIIQYGKEFPDAIPNLLKIDRLETNFVKVQELDQVVRKLEKLLDGVKDARLVAAGEAYTTSLKVYNVLQGASDLDLPGISAALEDLGKRFSGQGRNSNNNVVTAERVVNDSDCEVEAPVVVEQGMNIRPQVSNN